MFRGSAWARVPDMRQVFVPYDVLVFVVSICLLRTNQFLSSDARSFENEPCRSRDRLVHHLVTHGADALPVDDKNLTCLRHLIRGRSQYLVDDRDLCRMDRTLGVKAKIGRSNCLSPQTPRIGNVEVRGIQYCDPGSRSGLNDAGPDRQKWLPGCLGSEVGRHIRRAEK